ncbi:DUF6445 family protein [Streptomyces sp. NPDC029216]|uniref:DUF6445 family protein n=1 Tax=Streptomyces sp. NPDC029216 TaxID=3154701 RepID=UPI00340C7720
MSLRPPHTLPVLPCRKPARGRDYWVLDDVLPDVDAVRERCLAKGDWVQGAPHKPEPWPGLRAMPALEPAELARVEKLVRRATGAKRIWAEDPSGAGTFHHNCVQVVGEGECESRPHTDSRTGCRYAAVLYLTPGIPEDCGTSFYRQSPGDSFTEDLRVPHRYNRLLLYSADLIHSATGYWGSTLEDKRMTAVFFWMA